MRKDDFDPEGLRLPIKFDRSSNGEFAPPPLTAGQRLTNRLAHAAASDNARRLGVSRRSFLISAAGAASTLAACNAAHAALGVRGGSFALPEGAGIDAAAAESVLKGDEFIFDVQTHCVDPSGAWAKGADGERWSQTLLQVFQQSSKCANGSFDCYSAEVLAKEVYLDSDTDVAVVSALWGQPNPTPPEYFDEIRDVTAAIGGEAARALVHAGVFPQEPGAIEAMEAMVAEHRIEAWKLYPQYGSDGRGIRLDQSEHADRFFEKARALGVRTVAVHKGISLPHLIPAFASPVDMGAAARANPDLTFLTYHSGFETNVREGAYDPADPKGVDRLIKSHQDAGFAPNQGNLYAEMGAMWRFLMGRPEDAAHVMGKLLKYFGPERIMWGTDSVWFGSPQDQIQAFRAFEISPEFQERYGYPALDAEAKRKIFGLNGARVYGIDVEKLHGKGKLKDKRAEYRQDPNPCFATFGPKTRREFNALWKARDYVPG